jgi:AP endonuclease 2
MRLLTWNVNGLRAVVASKGGLAKLLGSLEADIICFQETKLARDELVEELAISDGWESFFDFAKKPGYSGTRKPHSMLRLAAAALISE